MKRAASECSDNDVFFDDGDMLKDGSVSHLYIQIRCPLTLCCCHLSKHGQLKEFFISGKSGEGRHQSGGHVRFVGHSRVD